MTTVMRCDDNLSIAIDTICNDLKWNWGVRETDTILGTHEITYSEDDIGEYASVGFILGGSRSVTEVYIEIEDGTYGTAQALRIYKEDL